MKPMKRLTLVLMCFSTTAMNSAIAAAKLDGNLICSVETTGAFDTPQGWFDTCTYAPIVSTTELRAIDAKLVYGSQSELDAYAAARAYAGVKANYGSLEIYATSEVRMDTYGFAAAKAQASAAFTDSVLVASSTLEKGSIVSLRFNYDLDFSNISNVISTNSARSYHDRFSYDLQSYYSIGPNLAAAVLNNSWDSQLGEIYYNYSTFIDPKYTHEEIIQVKVGDTIDIYSSLFGRVSSTGSLPFQLGGSYLGYADIGANFFYGKGATLHLTSIGSDVALISASGHSYGLSAAVPEPSEWFSLSLGLLVLILTQWRSTSRFPSMLINHASDA